MTLLCHLGYALKVAVVFEGEPSALSEVPATEKHLLWHYASTAMLPWRDAENGGQKVQSWLHRTKECCFSHCVLLKLHLGFEGSGLDQCSAAVMGDLLEPSPICTLPLDCWWALTKNLFTSLVGRPALGKLLDCPNFGIMGAAVLLRTFSCSRHFCSLPLFCSLLQSHL